MEPVHAANRCVMVVGFAMKFRHAIRHAAMLGAGETGWPIRNLLEG
jgi:hypothetical protein